MQTTDMIGDLFYTKAGYNEWAEANNIIVLYPQAKRSMYNPNGCFDWWGYNDKEFSRKNGRQMSAIKAMIDRLSVKTQ